MNKYLIFLTLAVLTTSFLKAVPPGDKKDFLGDWKFENPYAPESYQKGFLLIEEKENTLAGEIKFADGYKVLMRDIVYAEDVLRFMINVEGYSINIKATLEGNKIKGSAATPDGNLPFEAERVKKEVN